MDLEWFDTAAFFEALLQQSLSVTAKLSQNKEEVTGSTAPQGWRNKRSLEMDSPQSSLKGTEIPGKSMRNERKKQSCDQEI